MPRSATPLRRLARGRLEPLAQPAAALDPRGAVYFGIWLWLLLAASACTSRST